MALLLTSISSPCFPSRLRCNSTTTNRIRHTSSSIIIKSIRMNQRRVRIIAPKMRMMRGTSEMNCSCNNVKQFSHRSNNNNIVINNNRNKRCIQTFATSNNNSTNKNVIIPRSDYRIAAILLSTSAVLTYINSINDNNNNAFAIILGVLGLFLAVQTSRVKFKFDEQALEVIIITIIIIIIAAVPLPMQNNKEYNHD